MAGGGVFGEALYLYFDTGTVVFCVVMIALMVFEGVLHAIEEECSKRGYKGLIRKLYREFMIMGFISFGILLATEANSMSNTKWYTSFHFAHVVILFIGITFMVQSAALVSLIYFRQRTLLSHDNCTSEQLLLEYINMHDAGGLTKWFFMKGPVSLPIPELREKVEFKILQEFFIRSYNLPFGFKFANYMCQVLKDYVISLVEVRPISWMILAALIVLNYVRILVIDPIYEAHVCERFPADISHISEGTHRLLQDMSLYGGAVTAPTDDHTAADTTPYGHRVCNEYTLRYTFFCEGLIFLYLCGVWLSSEIYFSRLIDKVLDREEMIEWIEVEEQELKLAASARPNSALNLEGIRQEEDEKERSPRAVPSLSLPLSPPLYPTQQGVEMVNIATRLPPAKSASAVPPIAPISASNSQRLDTFLVGNRKPSTGSVAVPSSAPTPLPESSRERIAMFIREHSRARRGNSMEEFFFEERDLGVAPSNNAARTRSSFKRSPSLDDATMRVSPSIFSLSPASSSPQDKSRTDRDVEQGLSHSDATELAAVPPSPSPTSPSRAGGLRATWNHRAGLMLHAMRRERGGSLHHNALSAMFFSVAEGSSSANRKEVLGEREGEKEGEGEDDPHATRRQFALGGSSLPRRTLYVRCLERIMNVEYEFHAKAASEVRRASVGNMHDAEELGRANIATITALKDNSQDTIAVKGGKRESSSSLYAAQAAMAVKDANLAAQAIVGRHRSMIMQRLSSSAVAQGAQGAQDGETAAEPPLEEFAPSTQIVASLNHLQMKSVRDQLLQNKIIQQQRELAMSRTSFYSGTPSAMNSPRPQSANHSAINTGRRTGSALNLPSFFAGNAGNSGPTSPTIAVSATGTAVSRTKKEREGERIEYTDNPSFSPAKRPSTSSVAALFPAAPPSPERAAEHKEPPAAIVSGATAVAGAVGAREGAAGAASGAHGHGPAPPRIGHRQRSYSIQFFSTDETEAIKANRDNAQDKEERERERDRESTVARPAQSESSQRSPLLFYCLSFEHCLSETSSLCKTLSRSLWACVKYISVRVMHAMLGHHTHTHSDATQTTRDIAALQEDFATIFLFRNAELYYIAVEMALLIQCLYIALWATNLVQIARDSYFPVLWQIALLVPLPLNFLILKNILFTSCTLRSIVELDQTVANRICEDAEDERNVNIRLRRIVRSALRALEIPKDDWLDYLHARYEEVENYGLNPAQFKVFLHSIKVFLKEDSLKNLFRILDADRDGKVTWESLFPVVFPDLQKKTIKVHRKKKRRSSSYVRPSQGQREGDEQASNKSTRSRKSSRSSKSSKGSSKLSHSDARSTLASLGDDAHDNDEESEENEDNEDNEEEDDEDDAEIVEYSISKAAADFPPKRRTSIIQSLRGSVHSAISAISLHSSSSPVKGNATEASDTQAAHVLRPTASGKSFASSLHSDGASAHSFRSEDASLSVSAAQSESSSAAAEAAAAAAAAKLGLLKGATQAAPKLPRQEEGEKEQLHTLSASVALSDLTLSSSMAAAATITTSSAGIAARIFGEFPLEEGEGQEGEERARKHKTARSSKLRFAEDVKVHHERRETEREGGEEEEEEHEEDEEEDEEDESSEEHAVDGDEFDSELESDHGPSRARASSSSSYRFSGQFVDV